MCLGCVSSAVVLYILYIDSKMDQFKYLGILKQNVKQNADKLNMLDTVVSIRTTIRNTLRTRSLSIGVKTILNIGSGL